jgi:adenosylhomocysteine nucleosidase
MTVERAIAHPCVVFALRRESMYFRRVYPFRQRFLGAPCRAEFRGTPLTRVLMLETGVGFAAIETALRWCLSGPRFGDLSYRPSLIFLVGFSGGLQSGQRVGDLVLATEVVDRQGNRWTTCHAALLPGGEITLAPVLSVTEMVGDPREKQRLRQQHDAVAVDMESAAAARLCHEQNVPFACLRAISDDRNTALSPHLVELLRSGRVSMPRLAETVLRHPSSIRELMQLAANTRKAAKQLLAVRSLLDSLGFRERDSNKYPASRYRLRISGL